MIAGSIPDKRNPALRILCEQVVNKGNGELGISLLIRLEPKLLGAEVEGTIVSLLLSLINHWDFDALVGFAPNIATGISPQQMTFIQEEDY